MKILVVASALDLRYRLGCTPSWWQLLKAFHETGHDVIATSYLGDPVESPWWRTVPNPCAWESKVAEIASRRVPGSLQPRLAISKKGQEAFVRTRIRPRWMRQLRHVLSAERDVDLVLFLNAPVNHLAGIPEAIRAEFGVRVSFFDGDMPTILPKFSAERGFRLSYYEGADLSEYDAFFSTSRGALAELRNLGARNPQVLHYAADPDLFQPLEVTKRVDVAFYGHGSQMREPWMEAMLGEPSRAMPDRNFIAAGGGIQMDLGRTRLEGHVPFAVFPKFVAEARINLNITRRSHAEVEASSTARPFELAACGACIVSQPYLGIEEWFTPNRELLVVNSADEAVEVYRRLLADPEERQQLGSAGRQAILDRHTWKHRVPQLLGARHKDVHV